MRRHLKIHESGIIWSTFPRCSRWNQGKWHELNLIWNNPCRGTIGRANWGMFDTCAPLRSHPGRPMSATLEHGHPHSAGIAIVSYCRSQEPGTLSFRRVRRGHCILGSFVVFAIL